MIHTIHLINVSVALCEGIHNKQSTCVDVNQRGVASCSVWPHHENVCHVTRIVTRSVFVSTSECELLTNQEPVN